MGLISTLLFPRKQFILHPVSPCVMFRTFLALLLTAAFSCSTAALPAKFSPQPAYPLAHNSPLVAHDPNIIQHRGFYYLFKGGIGVPFSKSKTLDGPWEDMGPVLTGPSIIPKQNRTRPWAPAVIAKDNTFYCFYTVSHRGSNDSAIGIATSKELRSGAWKDHGAIIQTGTGPGSQKYPFKEANAIDPHVFIDPKDEQAYLIFGSFFSGMWQIPLSSDILSLKDPEHIDATRLATKPEDVKPNDEEGGFMTYRDGWYYFWFSHGKCCHFDPKHLPEDGKEYSIRVGRSKNARGPFTDKNGKPLTSGGGHVVYGSNHNKKVYAPGGLGVLSDRSQDILYYHFLNTSVGLRHTDAYMGWSYLEYINGWPVAKYEPVNSRA
ncbi:endo-arabinanase [Coccidioides posadasii str. Silveira]|uniref:Arabinan endo-1,5-alpha-L-arabinosidase n=3 Tax=Coccidioides posadasii TaxID=199306 RepID=E9CR16_COCPS|nr:endo-arabinanase [Coccidioides posadasii str. Silveira]KMM64101.1 endo-alpha-1,5-L-arabinanase [Coccidioides posadasii RMSCC 3488]